MLLLTTIIMLISFTGYIVSIVHNKIATCILCGIVFVLSSTMAGSLTTQKLDIIKKINFEIGE